MSDDIAGKYCIDNVESNKIVIKKVGKYSYRLKNMVGEKLVWIGAGVCKNDVYFGTFCYVGSNQWTGIMGTHFGVVCNSDLLVTGTNKIGAGGGFLSRWYKIE